MISSAARRATSSSEKPRKAGDLATRRAEGTLTDVVQVAIREAILAGDYRPGEKLAITKMAREQDVSLSVMREALTRLTADGLVTSEAMQGFSVVGISIADLEDVAELLKALIEMAVRRSIEVGGPAWEASLIAAHHLFRRAVGGEIGDASRAMEVDRAHMLFWEALTAACGNARLVALLTSLQRSMRLYHRIAITLMAPEAVERVETYGEITRRAVDGDVERAVQLLMEDIDYATEICRAYLAGEPIATPQLRKRVASGRTRSAA